MMYDAPPAMVYEIPAGNFAAGSVVVDPQEKQPISVMAFGQACHYQGIYEDNTSVHFYDHFDTTMNAKLVGQEASYLDGSKIVMWCSGWSSVTVEFNLEEKDLQDGLGLYLTHLSSDLHRGTYDSAIRIKFNGKDFVEKYVPASHDWIKDDYFDLTRLVRNKVLHAGANTIQIQLHPTAVSCYWLHCITIK